MAGVYRGRIISWHEQDKRLQVLPACGRLRKDSRSRLLEHVHETKRAYENR